MSGTRAKRNVFIIGVLACLLCAVFLSACNKDVTPAVKQTDRPLYHLGIAYDSDTLTMCVLIGFSGREEDRLDACAKWKSSIYPAGAMYRQEDVEITVDPAGLYEEMDGKLTYEQRGHEGVKYNTLKVALRYDTIYKSIKSDADEMYKAGNRYQHTFRLNETLDGQTVSLHLKNPNTASWYTVLIVSVIIIGIILVAVTAALKGRLWQKKKKLKE